MRHECPVRTEDLGPYLLGQLSPRDAAAVGEAVESCPSCTAEVARLRPVVEAMRSADPSRVGPTPAAPVPALDRVLASVRDERAGRRRRLQQRVGLVAAGLLLVVASGVGAVMLSGGDGREVTLTSGGRADGSAEVWDRGWGTSLELDVRGLAPGISYGAWLADSAGNRVPAGSFRPTSDGSARLHLSASLPLDDASMVGVTEIGGDDVLLGDIPG